MKAFISLLMLLILATLIGLGIWYFQVFSQSGDFGQQVRHLVSEARQKDKDFQEFSQSFEADLSLKEGPVEYFDRSLSEMDKLIQSHNDLKKKTSALAVPGNGRLVYEKLLRAWEVRSQVLSNYQEFIRANKEAFLSYQKSQEQTTISDTDREQYLEKAVQAEYTADVALAEAHGWEEKAQKRKADGANLYTGYLNAFQDAEYQIEKGL